MSKFGLGVGVGILGGGGAGCEYSFKFSKQRSDSFISLICRKGNSLCSVIGVVVYFGYG